MSPDTYVVIARKRRAETGVYVGTRRGTMGVRSHSVSSVTKLDM